MPLTHWLLFKDQAMAYTASKLQMKLSESEFSFSQRMRSFFEMVEVSSIAELRDIPLQKFTCFKGFKTKCRQELIAFIDFEGIGGLFEGYQTWKKQH